MSETSGASRAQAEFRGDAILIESDAHFKGSVLATSRKCWQMVGCPRRRGEQGHVGEEEGEEGG